MAAGTDRPRARPPRRAVRRRYSALTRRIRESEAGALVVLVLAAVPCAVLLAVQLVALIAYPYMETATLGNFRELGRALFGLVGLVVLFLAIRAVRATPAHTWVAAVIGVPVVALTIAEAVWPDSDPVLFWSSLLHALFYFYTGYGLLRYMFADNWVTRDELFATGATFTVVAWGFAYLYVAVQMIWPNSFTISSTALLHASESATSKRIAFALPPASVIAFTVSVAAASLPA